METIYGQLESILNIKFLVPPDEWEFVYSVDFYININDKYIGIQIRPISSTKSYTQRQWIEMNRKNHERFQKDFGGKVFFVFSVKAAGKKKIYNTEVVDEILDEIKRLKSI